ncbi:MAG: hypothetical protein WC565_02945 [Parcubacteria group bacterium]
MKDQDLIVRSFAGKTKPDDTKLTDNEKALLIKLLSNPTYFPEVFKSWLANVTPLIMPDIPISQVNGFLQIKKTEGYPADNRYFLRGDGTWQKIAADPASTWGDATATWGDATYQWGGDS